MWTRLYLWQVFSDACISFSHGDNAVSEGFGESVLCFRQLNKDFLKCSCIEHTVCKSNMVMFYSFLMYFTKMYTPDRNPKMWFLVFVKIKRGRLVVFALVLIKNYNQWLVTNNNNSKNLKCCTNLAITGQSSSYKLTNRSSSLHYYFCFIQNFDLFSNTSFYVSNDLIIWQVGTGSLKISVNEYILYIYFL